MTRPIKTIAIAAVFTLAGGGTASAQLDDAIDNWGTLGYILYNKEHREVNLIRYAAETATKLTHSLHKSKNSDNKKELDLLDTYLKAFSYLQTAFTVIKTGYALYDAPKNIAEDLAEYTTLLTDFATECAENGEMKAEDLNLYEYLYAAIDPITEDLNHISKSVSTLALVVAGNGASKIAKSNVKFAMTTKAMTEQAQLINKDLRHVQRTVHDLLYRSTCYIKARRSFWKAELWQPKDKTAICQEAYSRWKNAGGAYKFYNQ